MALDATKIAAALAWFDAIEQVYAKGDAAVAAVKATLAAHGVEVDNATLDGISMNAANRKAKEDQRIAGDPPVSPV